MVCYHPIKAFIVGVTPEGKKIHKFVKKEENLVECIYLNGKLITEYDLLPCGKCIGCRIERSRQWATRMMLELRYHEKACFITLTYNDDNLPMKTYINQHGEQKISYTLEKKAYQDFMKRLRRHYEPEKIRFFACGEYGSQTRRPHYHAILFGVDFAEDRKVLKVDKGYYMYRSPTLEALWPFGYSMICDVNWNTCAYVSRYCTKKFGTRQNIYYQTFNIEPEFNLMSRRPGLGGQFYYDNKDELYITQSIWMQNSNGGFKSRLPGYFDRLYDLENHEEMEEIKKNRKEMAENAMALRLAETDNDMFTQLEIDEAYFEAKVKQLVRNKI